MPPQPVILHILCNVLSTLHNHKLSAFPFSDRHGYGCYSGPYQLLYADRNVDENVQNGKSWGKDWNMLGLEISGKQIFYPLNNEYR